MGKVRTGIFILLLTVLVGGSVFAAKDIKGDLRKIENYIKQGNFYAATTEASKLVALAPDRWESYRARGLANYHGKNYNAALPDFQTMLDMEKTAAAKPGAKFTDLDAYFYIAACDYYKGDYLHAIDNFNSAIQFGTANRANPYVGRALTYYKLKDYDKTWADVHAYEKISGKPFDILFINELKKVSGKNQ